MIVSHSQIQPTAIVQMPKGFANQAVIAAAKELGFKEAHTISIPEGPDVAKKATLERIEHSIKAIDSLCDAIQLMQANIPCEGFKKQAALECKRVLDEINNNKLSDKEQKHRYQAYLATLEQHFENSIRKALPSKLLDSIKQASVFGTLLNMGDMYTLAGSPRPTLATITEVADNRFLIQTETPMPAISNDVADEYLRAKPDSNNPPAWYRAMPLHEKIFFDAIMQQADDREKVKQLLPTISSKLRSIPGVANFSRHQSYLVDETGKHLDVQPSEHYRSSMISSRDMLDLLLSNDEKDALMTEVAVSNLSTIIETHVNRLLTDSKRCNDYLLPDGNYNIEALKSIPILVQTLISPVGIGPINKEPDYSLYHAKQKAIEFLREKGALIYIGHRRFCITFTNLISTNHPLNPARHVAGTGRLLEPDPDKNQKNIQDIIKTGEQSTNPLIQAAAAQLKKLAKNTPFGFDNNQRELHLAALEEIIVAHSGGLSCGSCVSGKDRKGIQTMYVDAMLAYYALYQELPDLTNKDKNKRDGFTTVFARLFLSQHQQQNAGQNSPGANGIKTPDLYLPSDICKKIKSLGQSETLLEESSHLADNNDYRKALKRGKKAAKKSGPLTNVKPGNATSGLSSGSTMFKPSSKSTNAAAVDIASTTNQASPLSENAVKACLDKIKALSSDDDLRNYHVDNITIESKKNTPNHYQVTYQHQSTDQKNNQTSFNLSPHRIYSDDYSVTNCMMMIKTHFIMHPDSNMEIKVIDAAKASFENALKTLKIDPDKFQFINDNKPEPKLN